VTDRTVPGHTDAGLLFIFIMDLVVSTKRKPKHKLLNLLYQSPDD